jgi:hypothetical protein
MGADLTRERIGKGASSLWEPGEVAEGLQGALYRSPLIDADIDKALFRLSTVGRFLVQPGRPTIIARTSGATDEDVLCILKGPVAALRSCLERTFALRGSAVDIDGRGLAVCGSASGTSTLLAALVLAGHRVVADGVVVVGPSGVVSPAPESATTSGEQGPSPALTLWPDSAEALGLDPSAGALVRPSLASRLFRLGAVGVTGRRPVTLAALAILTVDNRLGAPGQEATRTPLSASGGIRALLETGWHTRVVEAIGAEQEYFQWATAVVSRAPTVWLRRADAPIRHVLSELVPIAEDLVALAV